MKIGEILGQVDKVVPVTSPLRLKIVPEPEADVFSIIIEMDSGPPIKVKAKVDFEPQELIVTEDHGKKHHGWNGEAFML